jgi:exopolysaccharide biosynthesis polyprenyl glycosylphosphotransferase
MPRIRRAFVIHCVYVLIDVFFIWGSIALACWLRQATLPFAFNLYNIFLDYRHPYYLVFVSWFFVVPIFNNLHGLYETRREQFESEEVWRVTQSILSSVVLVIVLVYILKIEGFPRSILISIGFFTYVSLVVWRILKRQFVAYLVAQGYNNFNVLIIGAGKVGMALANEIEQRPSLGLRIVGFLDDFKPTDKEYNGYRVVGKISEFVDIARREFVNKIFITIHHDSKLFLDLLEQAKELKIAVRVIPHGFDLTTEELSKYNIGLIPVLEYSNADNFRKHFGKRLFDLTIALLTVIVLMPVFLAIAILIKLDSPGQAIYHSRRYGRRGRQFMMYKFRSMVSNADQALQQLRQQNEVDGPIFKMRKDPRVTPMGRFLRKYSLDEMPQLFNVIKGDMSLVGPRPLPIEQIEKEDLRQLQRLEVRPGITGLWQIRGRSDISFERLVKWDIWYINNWSFWLDLKILLQTIPVVIKGKGAY